jgi:hypothetical protein
VRIHVVHKQDERDGCVSSLEHTIATCESIALEESLSITTGRCDLAIATHARKMHKNLFVVVHLEVLDND